MGTNLHSGCLVVVDLIIAIKTRGTRTSGDQVRTDIWSREGGDWRRGGKINYYICQKFREMFQLLLIVLGYE